MNVGEILLHAAAASTFAKPLVDMLKKSPMPTPSWTLPILAVAFGVGICFCLSLALGQAITGQVIGANILAGIFAGIGAVAQTELQRNVDSPKI